MNDYSTIERIAPWIVKIQFTDERKEWRADLFPRGVVVARSFTSLVTMVTNHVAMEIIEMVACALDVDASLMREVTRDPEVSDARRVATLALADFFPFMRQKEIAYILGWSTNAVVSRTLNDVRTVRDVHRKYAIVRKAYPIFSTPKATLQ